MNQSASSSKLEAKVLPHGIPATSFMNRMSGLWPYILIVISLAGLAYIFLSSGR